MKKITTATIVTILLGSASAYAADVVAPQETNINVTDSTFSWTGFYAGGQIGGSWSRGKAKGWGDYVAAQRTSPDPDGFIGGLYAGYNFDIGHNIVLGADTDFMFSDMDGHSKINDGYQDYKVTMKQKWMGATRVRVGYAVDRFLPYIAGGVAYGRLENHIGAKTGSVMDWKKTMTGWTIGTGVDYAFTDNIIARVEYRYTDFGSKTHGVEAGSYYKAKLTSNDFRVGVAYKF